MFVTDEMDAAFTREETRAVYLCALANLVNYSVGNVLLPDKSSEQYVLNQTYTGCMGKLLVDCKANSVYRATSCTAAAHVRFSLVTRN